MGKKLFIMLFIITISFLPSACKTGADSFRFIFMTDIHVQPEQHAAKGFARAILKVNELAPNFVITGGDLIMDALGQSFERADSLYNLYAKMLNQFQMPVYNTIGNHEVFGLYENSGIPTKHVEYGKKMFKNRLGEGKTYYSFDYDNWHFIILDGIGFTPDRRYVGQIDSLQLLWLKSNLLKLDKNTPIVISTHIPLFSIYGQMKNGPTFAMSESSVITNALDVMEILQGYNLRLVLQGHLHIVEEICYHNTSFITGGAVSGAWWKGARDSFPEGFIVIDIKGNDFTWNYVTYGWHVDKAIHNE
jgi:3',5'-cyclic AMP phosphodiesterase CpdA